RPVRLPAEPRPPGEGAARPVALGQAPRSDHDALGRHEAARADRQGAGARAEGAVSGRADRGRGRGAAPRHVGAGPAPARRGRHHHPHHALHRRGRGDGRSHRRDPQGRADRGRGEDPSDENARQEAAHAASEPPARAAPGRARRLAARAQQRRHRARVRARRRGGRHLHPGAAAPARRSRHRVHRPQHAPEHARGNIRQPGERAPMSTVAEKSMRFNGYGVLALYKFEMARFRRTLWQSLATPVITTSLYFVVFGSAIGSRMGDIEGVHYGAFIVPGLMMLTLFTESLSNASFGIHMPKWVGTIYEILSAPLSAFEIVLAYVGAAATKSIVLGLVILATASLFVPLYILHPVWMVAFLVLVALAFSLAGFVIGVWAKGFEQLQFIPMLIITPLTFLGGAFYSIEMLPEPWRTIS